MMRRYYHDPIFRDEVISQSHNRRVRDLGLEGITYPKALITWLLEEDGYTCGLCGELVKEERGPWGPSIGHVVPLARGGKHEVDNLRLEHLRCNLRKGDKLDEELER